LLIEITKPHPFPKLVIDNKIIKKIRIRKTCSDSDFFNFKMKKIKRKTPDKIIEIKYRI
jgi:hypothetical protein